VLVDNTTDEVDVVNVVGGGVVVKTDADEDDVFVVSAVREDKELAIDEIAEDMLEIADEEITTGAIDVVEAGVLFDIVLIETLVDVVVMGSVVELVIDNVVVEVVVSKTVEVVSVGVNETVEVVMVLSEVVVVVDRFDNDWPFTRAPRNQSSNTP
jgi:hypothetical protein